MSPTIDRFVPGFTEELVAQWNRGPRVFRNALREPLFDERDFMGALRGAARDYMADPHARVPPGRVYINGDMVKPHQLGPLLPRTAAETCDQYVSRITQAHPGDGIGIVLDNCEKHVTSMRDALVPILHRLFAHAGYPARRNHLCIYAGNYRSTPFGIHRDDCHVVMFCGVGKKSMAFWPRPYFDQRKDLLISPGKVRAAVKDHIGQATVLEIGPLDALYWSADDWHVAVSETDDFQAALSVGLYHHGSSAELMTLLDVMAAVTKLDGQLDIPGLPAATDGRLAAQDLRAAHMAGFFEKWERLREMITRPEEVEYRALGMALRLISSAGYGPVRAQRPAPPLPGTVLSCPVPDSLIVASTRGGLYVGANGHAYFYDAAVPAIDAAIRSLRTGQPQPFDDLIGSADAESRDKLSSAIADFVTAGAVSAQLAN